MAENESLDLWQPGGQRWLHVHNAVKKHASADEVATKIKKKLPRALRKAIKELLDSGVTTADLLSSRHNPEQMKKLVRKSHQHDYAHLFAQTAAAEPKADNQQLIAQFLNGIIERVSDQITIVLAGTNSWPEISGVRELLSAAQSLASSEIERISTKLAADPSWLPTVRQKKGAASVNATEELLSTSLLGLKAQ